MFIVLEADVVPSPQETKSALVPAAVISGLFTLALYVPVEFTSIKILPDTSLVWFLPLRFTRGNWVTVLVIVRVHGLITKAACAFEFE
jgi:hypothetical protein